MSDDRIERCLVPGGTATRHDAEAWIDQLIRANRFTIAVVFPVVGALLLIASAEAWLPSPLSFNAGLILFGVAVMRSPLVGGILPLVNRRVVAGFGLLVAYTYAIEYIGLRTGYPYGSFTYGVDLGPMLGGLPIALPLLFLPLVVNAYLLWLLLLDRRSSRLAHVSLAIPTVVLMDVVLDPGAVALGFWAYEAAGGFYGVPLSNYLGWILSATVAVVILDLSFDSAAIYDRVEACPYMLDDLVSFVILWVVINLWFGQLLPAIIGCLLAVLLAVGKSME